ncbi:hypothetical protein EMPS_07347 [Entomortierella parvispora]|uniref:AMP-activated protein kinase glycogen-binding domain-containing protein n=1 Tax=Entomortierella parvispora TaxID=205924 RepID=A0A9P3HE13_9FUNG|nr:hypothetical protein EMPS_07347 [Entomortierella parvispora]
MLGRTTSTTNKPTGATGTGVGSTTGTSSSTTGGFQRNTVSKLTTGFNTANWTFARNAPSSNSPSSPSPINSFRSGSFGSSSSTSSNSSGSSTGSPTSAMAQARAALLQKSQQGAGAAGGASPVSSNSSPLHSPTPDRITPTGHRFNLRDTSSVHNTSGSHSSSSTTTTPSYVRPSATKEGGGSAVSNSPFATRNQIQTHTLRQTANQSSATTSPTRSRFSRPGSISSASGVAAAPPAAAAAATVTLKPTPAAVTASAPAPAPVSAPVVTPAAVIASVAADEVVPSPLIAAASDSVPAPTPVLEPKVESMLAAVEPADPIPAQAIEDKETVAAEVIVAREETVLVARENTVLVETKVETSVQIEASGQEPSAPEASAATQEKEQEAKPQLVETNTVQAPVSADMIENLVVEKKEEEVLVASTKTTPIEEIVSTVDISVAVVDKEEEPSKALEEEKEKDGEKEERAIVPDFDAKEEEVVPIVASVQEHEEKQEEETVAVVDELPAEIEDKGVVPTVADEIKKAEDATVVAAVEEKEVGEGPAIEEEEQVTTISNVEQIEVQAQEDASLLAQVEEEEAKAATILTEDESPVAEDTTDAQEEPALAPETAHTPEEREKEEENVIMNSIQVSTTVANLAIAEVQPVPVEEIVLAKEEEIEVAATMEEQELASTTIDMMSAEESKEEPNLESEQQFEQLREQPQEEEQQEEEAAENQDVSPVTFDEMHQSPPSPARMTREAATAAFEAAVEIPIVSKTKEEMLQSAPEEPVMLSPSGSTRSSISSSFSSFSVNGVTEPSSPIEDSQNGRKAGVISQKFHWKHGGETVKVTGTFDNWQETVYLKKVPGTRDEFAAIVDLDRTAYIQFKFVVDGVWRCSTEFATEYDYSGHLNNVLHPISLEQQQQLRHQHHHHRQY